MGQQLKVVGNDDPDPDTEPPKWKRLILAALSVAAIVDLLIAGLMTLHAVLRLLLSG